MQTQSDFCFEASLDKNEYNEADLVAITVPLSLPYVNNQQNFERVNGEINFHGKILKYVKRKISNGSLILMCLPDEHKMRLALAKDDFFRYTNDLLQNNPTKHPHNSTSGVFKKYPSDYYSVADQNSNRYRRFKQTHFIKPQSGFLPSSHQVLPEQPPEFI